VPEITLSRVSGYHRSHWGKDNAHLFALSRTLRIRQIFGFSFSTDYSISPLPTIQNYDLTLSDFHEFSRAEGPNRQIWRFL
jgi:hypothetical protein